MPSARRFPPPWMVEEVPTESCWLHAATQGYTQWVYPDERASRAFQAKRGMVVTWLDHCHSNKVNASLSAQGAFWRRRLPLETPHQHRRQCPDTNHGAMAAVRWKVYGEWNGSKHEVISALFQIGVSLLVAVATASLTVWLSLRRFYREKWWEAKMRAYTDVIQALHHMKETWRSVLKQRSGAKTLKRISIKNGVQNIGRHGPKFANK